MRKQGYFSGLLACFLALFMVLAACKDPPPDGGGNNSGGTDNRGNDNSEILTTITSVTISISAPVNGGTPSTTASTADTAYTLSAVTWSPVSSKFLGGTSYTASVTLTANSGYTFSGLNSATVNGQSATISNKTNSAVTLSYTFPETSTKTVTGIAIKTQPEKLAYTHVDQLDLAGLAVTLTHDDTTTEDVSASDFASKNITANPAHGDNLVYSTHHGQPVTITYGNLTPLATNNLIVNPKTIANVEISVTAPVKSSTPDAAANGTGDFTIGTVTWSPSGSLFLGGTVYTVTFTLTADSGHTFTGLSSATINGQNAALSNNNGTAVTLSYTFPETSTKTVTGMAIKTQPEKLAYTHVDQLDLAGLAVTLTHDDTTTEDVSASDFASKNITANPAHGDNLVHLTHNLKPVTITYGELTQSTNNLTVNKAQGNFGTPVAINITYTSGLTLGNITLPAGYAWNAPTTTLNAGNSQPFAATFTDPSGNYNSASGSITVNVAKATGSFGTPAAVNVTYTSGLTLGNITLSAGYAWNAPTTTLNAGNSQSFAATFTDPSGNYNSASGSITVNVAKATGSFGSPAAVNVTYTSGLTLGNITLPAGYAWNTPNTNINAGNSQSFAATFTDPSGNYNSASGSITVNVAKATGSFGSPATVNVTYTSGLTLGNITLPAGYAWNTPNTNINAGNSQSFAATFTDPSGNYNSASGSITVNVAKAAGTIVTPQLVSKTHNSITVSGTASTGQTVEFALNSTNSAPVNGWQTSSSFSNLTANTDYYIFSRTLSNSNYETGVSGGVKITTSQSGTVKYTYYWIDEHDKLVINNGVSFTVSRGQQLVITAVNQTDGYTVSEWYLNGASTGQNGNSYTFSSVEPGSHSVGLVVVKGGKIYNTNISIIVGN